jgi:hypothetical protein
MNQLVKSLNRQKKVPTLVKKINTHHQKFKKFIAAPERKSKAKMSAYDCLFLSNFFWGMNDFGDAVIK